jgi:hypothetical protein
MTLNFSTYDFLLVVAVWYGINGILHDIFVLRNHKESYNRTLLRLLMDGHVLMLSSALIFAEWWIIKSGDMNALVIGIIVSFGMIIYCLMIFPFLKSIITFFVSIVLLITSSYSFFSM